MGRTVTTPGGHSWRVRRVWAPRLGGESLWDRFRRRTRLSRRVASEAGDVPDPGCAADSVAEPRTEPALVLLRVLAHALGEIEHFDVEARVSWSAR